jgi:hypothetical protein
VIDDNTGDLFVAYDSVGQNSVIYVVHPDQSQEVFATFPVGAGLDGMTPAFFGNLYLADAFLGYVWRVSASGGTPEILLDMHAPGSLQIPGPNGIKFDLFQRTARLAAMTSVSQTCEPQSSTRKRRPLPRAMSTLCKTRPDAGVPRRLSTFRGARVLYRRDLPLAKQGQGTGIECK